jgi:hypothetical protein
MSADRSVPGVAEADARRPPRRAIAVAFHEAGHAVMGWHLGVAFRTISIRGTPRCRGWVWFCRDFSPGPHTVDKSALERAVLVYLAGPLAAWPYERRFRAPSAQHDLERAYRLIEQGCGSDEETRDRWARLRERAWNVLGRDDLWRAVSALARVLLARGTLTGREARTIIARAVGNPPSREQDASRAVAHPSTAE